MNMYVHEFRDWLINEDKGPQTVRTYISVMTKFSTWAEATTGTPFNPADVTPLLLQDYRSHMQTVENAKPATINKALATLKTFFGWAIDAGHAPTNPALKVKMKRVQQTHAPKWLNDAQLNRLLYAVDGQRNEFKRSRDLALIRTMLDAGLRVEEVANLRVRDVDLEAEAVTVVNGKGGKYRVVYMTKELRKALRAWMASRSTSTKEFHQSSEVLFVSERSGRMGTRAISYVVDGYLERAGLVDFSEGQKSGEFSCHSLRHTFCKRLVNAGWPIQDVARVAGHDSIQTTMRYVDPSQDEMKQAMRVL